MFRFLLLLIIIVPAIEITLFILSGQVIGIWPTFLLIILTGIVGAWLTKRQGLQAIRLAQLQAQQGQIPSEAIIDGICILVGGIFLLAPGFLTDIIGLFMLIPQTRGIAKALLQKLFHRMIQNGSFIFISRR